MRTLHLPVLALLLIVFATAGLLGGQAFAPDLSTVAHLGLWRIENPDIASLLIAITHLGGSFVLLPLTLVVSGLLWFRGARRNALLLLGATMTGRAAIEIIKWLVYRPRPSLEPFPVYVSSQSFPSGHAGNSMITYLALAVFAVPRRWRTQAVAAAIILSLAIGATRPALGVHWPTDVIGGWCLGLLWVALWVRLSERRAPA